MKYLAGIQTMNSSQRLYLQVNKRTAYFTPDPSKAKRYVTLAQAERAIEYLLVLQSKPCQIVEGLRYTTIYPTKSTYMSFTEQVPS